MIQIPQFQQVPLVPQSQFGQMPYYYSGMPIQQVPQQTPEMMMQQNNMMNGNLGTNNSQMIFQNDYSMINGTDRKRPQSQNDLDFKDILDREKFKFASSKNIKGDIFLNQNQQQQILPQLNGFKAGNHNNHFNPKNLRDLIEDKQKKHQYADQLNQQLKIKKDLEHEKKILETKQNIHLHLERQKNDLISYNMPIRDQFGNILQSRGQPGNKNYQMQDWFTHVPNINKKYAQEDDVQFMEQNKQGLLQSISNPNMRNLFDFQRQQQGLLNFENKYKRQQFSQNGNNARESQLFNEQSSNFNKYNNQQFINQRNKGFKDNGSYAMNFDNYQEEDDDDDNRPVRLLTPTKFRYKAKGTQTPHTLDELNNLQNQQIAELYPELLVKENIYQFKTPPLSRNQSRDQTSYNKLPSDFSSFPNNSIRFTSYLKGDFKYANEADKMIKREQYIQLQNDQLMQMEEKKRQKEFQKLSDKREKALEDLRITREQYDLNQRYMRESQYNSVDKTRQKESNLYENPSLRLGHSSPKKDAFTNMEVQHVTSTSRKKVKRPRTPIEEATNPFENNNKQIESNSIVIQETPIKVKEQVGESVNDELTKLRSELRASQGFVQNELQSIKSKITDMSKQKFEQQQIQHAQAADNKDNNKVKLVDEIKRREQDKKIKLREKRDLQEADDDLAISILQNPGIARYDVENNKKIFFEYDDQYAFNPDRLNEELGTIIKDGELPSQKIMINYNNGGVSNNVNYLTYDEIFNKSSQNFLNNQQQKIEEKLYKIGINNFELPKSPITAFQQQKSSPLHSPVNNYNDQIKSFKTASLQEINRSNAINQDVDNIYSDLIKGNQENSKIFKYKKDNDKVDVEDFVLWNSKAARYR